ncbi:hypothetical protein N4G69_50000 [Streptomyces mirabilis]|uniref:hypothetical protein n=1 Tax=Streptomyces mirabilis TaxID=68239 RepID=UPI0021C05F82|nr:hypothetical protein [Streptomyces mirabilis]MCT9113550.1 hypothetical protein [Streptomyces mirabilis]
MCDILEAVGGPGRGSIVINFGNHGDNPNKLTAITSSWVILSGWGQNGTTTTDHMGHIAFIDANDPSDFKYRWVLPVIPLNGGTPNFYVDDARGGVGQYGILWRQSTSGATAAANCGQEIMYACRGQHTESMSYWWSTGRAWTLTEWAADSAGHWTGTDTAIPQRVLFSVPLSSMDSSLS